MVRMTLSRMKPRHENHRILQTHQRAATTGHAGAWLRQEQKDHPPLAGQTLYLLIKAGKYTWQDGLGSDFSLYAYLRDSTAPPPDPGEFDELYPFDYADEGLKARLLAQNRVVYEKIAALDIGYLQGFERQCAETRREALLPDLCADIESERPWITINKPLYYYDAADAAAWGEPVRLLFQAVTSGVQAGLYYGDNTCLQRLAALNP